MEDFLKLIKPDLTLIAALFGFLILFLKLFWNFLTYEDKLREENLNRVKDLNLNFRKKHIEKKISDWYFKIRNNTYEWAITSFSNDFFKIEKNDVDGSVIKRIKDVPEIEEILSPINLQREAAIAKKVIEGETSDYFYSTTGQEFFNSLDFLYNQKDKINSQYHQMIIYCRVLWWSCILIAFMSIIGIMLQLAKADEMLIHIWIFSYILLYLIGIYSFATLFYRRSKLIIDWENQQLFSNEE